MEQTSLFRNCRIHEISVQYKSLKVEDDFFFLGHIVLDTWKSITIWPIFQTLVHRDAPPEERQGTKGAKKVPAAEWWQIPCAAWQYIN